MVKNFKILLEKPTNLYVPGEVVSGKLYVEIDKPKPYKTISVSISGTVLVNAAYTLPTEELFNEKLTVWQAERAEDGCTIELPPSTYNFPFRFMLPVNIPTSFEGRHGQILYRVRGKVSSGALKMGHTVHQAITIFNQVTFDNHSVLSPKIYNDENTVTMACFACITGPVSTSLHLPRTGFCIGESISFSVNITNRGASAVQLEAILKIQESYMQSSGNRKSVFRDIGSISSDFIRRGATTTWRGGEIPITAGGPLSLLNCNRIRIEYLFVLKLNIRRVLYSVTTNSIQLHNIAIQVASDSGTNRALLSRYGFVVRQQAMIPPPTAGELVETIPFTPVTPAVNPHLQFGSLPRPQHSYQHHHHHHPPPGPGLSTGTVPRSTRPVTNRSMSLPVGVGPPLPPQNPVNYQWPRTQMSYGSYPLQPGLPQLGVYENIENEPVPSAPDLELAEENPSVTSPVGVDSAQPVSGELPPSYDEVEAQMRGLRV